MYCRLANWHLSDCEKRKEGLNILAAIGANYIAQCDLQLDNVSLQCQSNIFVVQYIYVPLLC